MRGFETGDADLDRLFDATYEKLREIAQNLFARELHKVTLQPTAIVNEAYLQLRRQPGIEIKSRGHFVALAARVMSRVLVDYARHRNYDKRGGSSQRITLVDGLALEVPAQVNVLELHRALSKLERIDERKTLIVELRFFGGLTIEETADALETSPATVSREWRLAKAYLYRELGGNQES